MRQHFNLWDVLVESGTAVKQDGARTLVVQDNGMTFDLFVRDGNTGSRQTITYCADVDAELARLGTDETDWTASQQTPAEILDMPVDADEVEPDDGHMIAVMPGFTLPVAAGGAECEENK